MKILIVLSNLLSNDELLTFGGMFAQQTEIPLTVLAVVGSDTLPMPKRTWQKPRQS